jgi:hypothetical protein
MRISDCFREPPRAAGTDFRTRNFWGAKTLLTIKFTKFLKLRKFFQAAYSGATSVY